MLGWFAAAHPSLSVEYTYAGEAESPDGKADVIDVKNADGFAPGSSSTRRRICR